MNVFRQISGSMGGMGSGSVLSISRASAPDRDRHRHDQQHDKQKAKPRPAPATTAPSPTAPASSAPAGPVATHSAAAGSSRVLGVYDGQHSPSTLVTLAKSLGSQQDIQYALEFLDASSWDTITDPSWATSQWQDSPYPMVWGVPMFPCGSPDTHCDPNASEFDAVAAGQDNDHFQTLAKNLVAAGQGSSYIRIGWEFQGDWFPWTICNADGRKDFVPAFRNIVTSMRSVSGANFKFIWNPSPSSNVSCSGQLEDYYPGDSYVDTTALDVYDTNGGDNSDSERWTGLLNGVNAGGWTPAVPDAIGGQSFKGYGLNWLAAFAAEHGKEAALPEWGLWATDSQGGGDDPYFVNQMAAWIKAHGTGPAVFWNYGDTGTSLSNAPSASAAFKSAFAGY